MPKRIVYIAGSIPTLTCTFIQREVFDLTDMGFEIDTVSMNVPPAGQVSEAARPLMERMIFLDRIPERRKWAAVLRALILRPNRLFTCLWLFCTASPMRSLKDYMRLGYHLIEACYLATAFDSRKPDHIHSHFIHGPTSLAMFLSRLIDVDYSFTMHASLIWTDPLAIRTKLKTCRFCVSISEYNKQYVLETYGQEFERKFHVIRCGVQLPETAVRKESVDGDAPVSVLAVGQLKRRKGFHVLIEAAGIVRDRGVPIHWTIVGEGDQRPRLEQLIRDHGLQDQVRLAGAQLHERIRDYLARADIFTLPCVVGDDNTRDGIPVSLMEAMAWRLPVVSTNIVGLPELIESGRSGVLVEPDDPEALADAIVDLASSPELREKLGSGAADKIARDFNSLVSARQLASLFDGSDG